MNFILHGVVLSSVNIFECLLSSDEYEWRVSDGFDLIENLLNS
jgi:hypothetical protein